MELLTKNQYMKRYNVGYEKLKRMIANKEVDYLQEADRIRIDDKYVSTELYQELKQKYDRLEERFETLKSIINRGG